jgi:hypothetical protein
MQRLLAFRFAATLLSLTLLMLAGCYYDNEQELYPDDGTVCDTANVSYTGTVLPIIRNECYICHDQGTRSGNVVLEGHSNLLIYANNGRLYGSIAHQSGFSAMPQGRNKLLDCQLAQIKSWIDAGAPNN